MIRRQQCGNSLRPFDDHHTALGEQFAETDCLQFFGAADAVGVEMEYIESRGVIDIQQHKRRAAHRERVAAQCPDDAAGEMCLAGAQIAVQGDALAANQIGGHLRRDRFGLGDGTRSVDTSHGPTQCAAAIEFSRMLDFPVVLEEDEHSGEGIDQESLNEQTEVARAPRQRPVAGTLVAIGDWIYLSWVLAVWLLIWFAGDRWWLATMLLFSPRWILLLPLVVLAPLSLLFRRRWLWGLLGITVLVAWPMMDLRITRRGLFPLERTPSSLRVFTLNTHFIALDPVALRSAIAATNPDIIALQEWMGRNRDIVFPDSSWHIVQLDAALVASRYPIQAAGSSIGEINNTSGVTYRYVVQLPQQQVTFFSVHLFSPHAVFSGVLHGSRHGPAWLAYNSRKRLREATELRRGSDDDTILAGDFNLPRDSTIFRSQLSGFTDAFTVAGLGWGLTYYSHWTEVRIDHILMGKNWQCDRCWVGPDVGSPHRPVIADLSRSKL